MTTNHRPHHDIVERTAEAMRSLEIPDGPSERLIDSTDKAVRTLETSVISRPVRKRPGVSGPDGSGRLMMIRIGRYGALSAAAMLMFGFFASTVLPGRETPVFSDVVRNVSLAKTVTFRWKLVSHPGEGSQYRKKGDLVRMDLLGDVTIIGDRSEKRGIRINHQRKTAWTFQGDAPFAKIFDPVEELRHVTPANMVPIEVRERGKPMTNVYRLKEGRLLGVTLDNSQTTLTADPETDLPIAIEIILLNMKLVHDEDAARHDVSLVFDDFQWDGPLDGDLFSLEPPDGFTVIDLSAGDDSAIGGADPDSPPSAEEVEVLKKLHEEQSR